MRGCWAFCGGVRLSGQRLLGFRLGGCRCSFLVLLCGGMLFSCVSGGWMGWGLSGGEGWMFRVVWSTIPEIWGAVSSVQGVRCALVYRLVGVGVGLRRCSAWSYGDVASSVGIKLFAARIRDWL